MRLLAMAIIVTGCAGAAASAPPASKTWTFKTAESPQIKVEDVSGSIRVVAGAPGEVVVEAKNANPERFTVEVTQDSHGVHARACCGKCGSILPRCSDGPQVDFALKVPPASQLSLASVSADIRVAGVRGNQELKSVSGAIDSADGQDVVVKTVSGNARVRSRGKTELKSVSGGLDWGGLCGAGCGLEMKTVSGNVRLAFVPKSSFALGFKSVSGGLEDNLGTTLQKSEGRPGGSVQARFGQAEGQVQCKTVSGSLELVKQ